MLKRHLPLVVLVLVASSLAAYGVPAGSGSAQDAGTDVLPEDHRAFLEDGPGWLLDDETLARLFATDIDERQAFMEEFLGADLIPETELDELREGIRRRRLLALQEFMSVRDVRARLLFLHGRPLAAEAIECGMTFRPIEIWTYPLGGETTRQLVLYRPEPTLPFRLWFPIDSKRVLYSDEMEYWLEQYYELGGPSLPVERFDKQLCPDVKQVDDATGIDGLNHYRKDRPTNQDIRAFLEPPADLVAWAREAAATELPEMPEEIPIESLSIYFPDRDSQRIVTRFYITIPAGAGLQSIVAEEGTDPEIRLDVEGILEQGDRIFEDFKARFKLAPNDEDQIILALDRSLRPNREFVVRLRIEDEIGGRVAWVTRAFRVPSEHEKLELPAPPEDTMVAMAEDLAKAQVAGADSLVLVPPNTDVVVAVWRAEALVTGQKIEKVVFSVDGETQLTRSRPPWTAEVKLAEFPTEQIVKAEGLNGSGEVVASDQVVLNQPTGALRVRILSPERGTAVSGSVEVRAEVVVPENRRVETVEFRVNDEVAATSTSPPWVADVEVPGGPGEIAYIAVIATLDNGSRAEDVRFLNSPQFMEEVDVSLVELFTTVTDKTGRLVKGLTEESFEIYEDGRPQQISKFELVEDLPLTIGIAIDSSSSMVSSLPEAQQAAVDFLESVVTPRDRVFALTFSGRPVLLVPPTDDVSAVQDSLSNLRSLGMTTLHDAIVTSLHYFRGFRGRRALIILSDGEDTASHIPFNTALEFARRSGVVVYTVGLNISKFQTSIRGKLSDLAEETGGRVFFISQAEELRQVYREIEDELRSQYLLTYSSDRQAEEGEYHEIEVRMKGKYKARTLRGYYS
jgi:VWFA-related protein